MEGTMQAQHTLGPWEAIPGGMVRTVDGKILIADLYVLDLDSRSPRSPTMEANARLIAAAPDLLNAAGWALGVMEGNAPGPGERGACDMLRDAIAKAEGGAS